MLKNAGLFSKKSFDSKFPPRFRKRICINKTVIFDNGPDCHLAYEFPNTTTVILHNCDKNFVYYNLNPSKFPKLETVFCNSHPCEFTVLHRFKSQPTYKCFLIDTYYNRYSDDLHQWWNKSTSYIIPITSKDYYITMFEFQNYDCYFEKESNL